MHLLYRRLLHALDNHGLRGTLLRVLRRPFQARDAVITAGHAVPEIHPFDLRHNTETSGYVPGEVLVSGSPADLYNTAYYGISPSTLIQAIAALPIDPTHSTFVDLGCGKGRAVLVAAHEHFQAVFGIEISPILATVAQANTATYPNITIQAGDASTMTYPPGPLVIFSYHAFLAPLLRKVLANIVRQSNGREIFLLFANPGYPQVFTRFPTIRELWTKDFTLSDEDAAADRHGILFERYTLRRLG